MPDLPPTLLYLCLGTSLALILGLAIIAIGRLLEVRIVPEKQRLAIYRLGRFDRIRGPGPVTLMSGLDGRVEKFDVTEQPRDIAIPGLFLVDIPVGLTLNLHYAFDPERVIGDDRERLTNLFEMTAAQRQHQFEVKVTDALNDRIPLVFQQFPLPAAPSIIDKLMPVLPGTRQRRCLLNGVRSQLSTSLRSTGYRLNEDEPIIVTKIHLGDDLIQAFGNRRTLELVVDSLRQNLPQLSEEMVAQMFQSIQGLEGIATRIWDLYNEADYASVREKDGDATLIADVSPRRRRRSDDEKALPPEPVQAEEGERLSRLDLAILKPVPGG